MVTVPFLTLALGIVVVGTLVVLGLIEWAGER